MRVAQVGDEGVDVDRSGCSGGEGAHPVQSSGRVAVPLGVGVRDGGVDEAGDSNTLRQHHQPPPRARLSPPATRRWWRVQ